MTDAAPVRLSFCITTRNRSRYIAETLENLLAQATPEVEVVVVDGASTDDTVAVVRAIGARHPALRLYTPAENAGLDADYDKAVELARGTHCWLFADDDLLAPGAVERVLAACREEPAVVVVDASVHGPDFGRRFETHRLKVGPRRYGPEESEAFFVACARHLTFIGGLVVRRDFWRSRERRAYFGTEFVHVGVLFQAPLPGDALVIRAPLVKIRYGLGNWTGRAFEVWMYKWPRLVWSFAWLSPAARRRVSASAPWANPLRLLVPKALGQYGWKQYRELVVPRAGHRAQRLAPWAVAALPDRLVYVAAWAWLRTVARGTSVELALAASPHRCSARTSGRP